MRNLHRGRPRRGPRAAIAFPGNGVKKNIVNI